MLSTWLGQVLSEVLGCHQTLIFNPQAAAVDACGALTSPSSPSFPRWHR